jgi:hypothetical protein
MFPSVSFYAGIWRSMWLNLGHNGHVFPSLPLPFMKKLESRLSQATSSPESHPNHTSALGVNFHHSFPFKLSIAPWAVYVPCCLKIIATFMSGLKRSPWHFSYIKNKPLSDCFIFYFCVCIRIPLVWIWCSENKLNQSQCQISCFSLQSYFSYVNQVRREGRSMWVK